MKFDPNNTIDCAVAVVIIIAAACLSVAFVVATIKLCSVLLG
jgi:hypothetical protein